MEAVAADRCVSRRVPGLLPDVLAGGAWHVLAVGKAAATMLRAALDAIPHAPHAALCVCPAPAPAVPPGVEVLIGGHPVPTDGSLAAGERALAFAAAVGPDAVLLVLLSGGASSLLAAPVEAITLADKQAVTRRLLLAGADITALNTVRKHLSRTKGGRLAAASRGATVCLALSDVVGDDPSWIGSGPTVADPTTFADALAVLDRFGGRASFPAPAVAWLEAGQQTGVGESPKPGAPALRRARTVVIAGGRDALRGAQAAAVARGYRTVVLEDPIVGEARLAAVALATRLRDIAAREPGPVCVLSGGETTVTVTGTGRGGRNQECALAAFDLLAGLGRPAVLVSVGTDGIDGPTDAAGAVADSTSLARARAAGLASPAAVFADNDTYPFFHALGDLVVTGPTGTNVGDVQVFVAG